MSTDCQETVIEEVETPAPAKRSEWWAWIVLAIILVVITAFRIRWLRMPLERDEGEFAYMGQLLLDRIPPYKIAYNMKLPGVYIAYALIMAVFGQTIVGIHIGFLLVNLLSIVLVFLLGRRLIDSFAGVIAAASYGFATLSVAMLGAAAHATHFVLPFVLGGMILMLRGIRSGKSMTFFWTGLLLGIAFIMKQHAVMFIPFAAFYVFWTQRQSGKADLLKKEGLLLLASAIPFGLTLVIVYALGVFRNFWFWTFTYARQYASEMPVSAIPHNFAVSAQGFLRPPLNWFWIIGAIGLVLVFVDERLKEKRLFLAGFAAITFLAACPGFFFRQHYFIPFISALGLLIGVVASSSWRLMSRWKYTAPARALPLGLVIMILLLIPITDRAYFRVSPAIASHLTYGSNPFPEMIEIAKYIKAHSDKNDLMAVLGSEPETLFYAHRRSATGFIYTYGLMENQDYAHMMQLNMIHEIETKKPKYIVFVSSPASWLARTGSDNTIFTWANEYLTDKYDQVGVVDIISDSSILFLWDEAAKDYSPESSDYIFVFRRKS